jgi:hypothetical protein
MGWQIKPCNGPFQDLLAYLHVHEGIAVRTLADLFNEPVERVEKAILYYKAKPIWGKTND